MRRITKKSMAMLLALVMCMSLFSVNVWATTQGEDNGQKLLSEKQALLVQNASNDYTTWKQFDPAWGNVVLWPDAKYPTMERGGCWITSVAILLRHYNVVKDSNVNTFNPLICAKRLMDYGVVNSYGDYVNLFALSGAYPGFSYVNSTGYSESKLRELFNQGYACIVHETKGHYVAVRSISESTITVMDPGSSYTSTLSASDEIQYFKTSGSLSPDNNSKTKPQLSNCNMPGTITVGQTYSVHGTVSSGGALTNVTAAVYDVNGNMKTGQSVNPGSSSYDIKNLDYSVYFNKLSPGVYTYKVSATNSSGTTEQRQVFIVLAKSNTVKPGNYKIRPKSVTGIYLDVADHNSDSGANVCLISKEKSNYQTFTIASAGGGYYTIKNRGSKKYLDVYNANSESGTNVQLWTGNKSNAQLWQILPTGDGYCFVPKCAIENCLDVKDGNLSSGSNIQTYSANLSAAQRFTLATYSSSIETNCTKLSVRKKKKAMFTATYQTKSAGSIKFVYNYKKSVISVSSGKWNNHVKQITVKGKKAGKATLTIKLVNSKTNKVLAKKSIPITVTNK